MAVAGQYGRQGVRCNAVAPAIVLTECASGVSDDVVKIYARHVVVPELGRPEAIAARRRLPGQRRIAVHQRITDSSGRRALRAQSVLADVQGLV
ncbi:SDR family oxidoreductase [Rhodococcus sp. NPDC059968]|uniref:SDR family oxidoreductase n=1 Tax=Rhodococcus sp. NPDC059968 TaxID=3347017 RepID=UPI003671223E